MKVLGIKGNVVTFDMTKQEENLLLIDGLQKWINKEIGENKLKVIPIDKDFKINKKTKSVEIDDAFAKECVDLAVIEAIKLGIKMDKAVKKLRKKSCKIRK